MGNADMIVRELLKHFPARAPEWINAVTLTAWGAYVLLNPSVFDYQPLLELAYMAPVDNGAAFWGLVTFGVGFLRMVALFVNGAYSRTPIIRLVTALISAFVWSQIVISLLIDGDPRSGLVMYASAVCVDLLSAYRASKDIGMVESTRWEARRGVARGGSSGTYERHSTA